MTATFHAGEREVQRRAGEAEIAGRVARSIRDGIPDAAAAFVAEQPFVVLASADADGHPVASMLTGQPGFVHAAGIRTLVIDALPGPDDPLSAALGRPATDVGSILIEPATRRRVRINGSAHRDGDGIVVKTGQVFANCPKYISARHPIGADRSTPAGARTDSTTLGAADRRLIERADAFFVASTGADAGLDVSHRGGDPGFVALRGDAALTFPDYAGNSMFMTLGNLAVDPRVGLLFVDWETGDLLQLQGTATVDWSPERAAATPGARRVVDVELARVSRYPGASPLRWELDELSRFNP